MIDDTRLFTFLRQRFGPLSQADVDAVKAALSDAVPASGGTATLKDEEAFYKALRAPGGLFAGGLKPEQFEGLQALLKAMGAARWPIAFAANALATAYLETNQTMQPVAEAYWVKNAEAWRKKNLRYYPHYGRGYVQLTWPKNYERADTELALGGTLIANLDRALEPEIAAKIMVRGMANGWFTAKKLGDYLPAAGPGKHDQHKEARRIINGTDRNTDLANYALKFQDALQAGGWS